jgi:RNA polymerase sigma factor (sigma-70 family)
MERTVPRMEEAYVHLRPLFFGALGRLARQGFVVSPADSMDLIHDFFVDAWPTLNQHFDPDKGGFEGYAYAAFVRFARPRIIRLQRWQHSLVGADQLDAYPTASLSILASPDDKKIRRAISQIPPKEQEILRRYVYSDSASERSLAREFLMTRYHLREVLVDALGRVAISLDRPAGIAPADWDVACSLWRDCRTIQETAAYLALTPEQVRRANTRNILFLKNVLKQYQGSKSFQKERKDMYPQYSATAKASSAMELLKQALESPNQDELLTQVRTQSNEILEQMASSDQAPDLDVEKLPAEWVARVYQALFEGAATQQKYEVNAIQELFSVHAEKDTSIGEAFRDLLAGLPDSLSSPMLFSHLPHIAQDEESLLRQAPDVRASLSESVPFLPYGIRPLKVFYATEAVSGLSERLLELRFIDQDRLILGEQIQFSDDRDTRQNLEDLMVLEIGQTAEVNPDTSKALYSWLIRTAQYRPYLFKGFRAQVRPHSPHSIVLFQDSSSAATAAAPHRWATQMAAGGHAATSV